MKLRLAASISALMAGERTVIFKDISGVSRSCSSFQFQRFKSSKGFLFKVHNDDDDFSDLGPPVERALGQLKLVTEKRDPFPKLDNGRKVPSSKSPRNGSKQNIKDKIVTLDKPHQTSCEFANGDDATASTYTSDAATMDDQRSISVGDVPSTISLSQLVEAVSVFGKVCAASVSHLPDGLHCWNIQFENLKSRNRAIRAGALTVGSFHLPLCPLRASMVVAIRINGISEDASFCEIHSICKSIGTTLGLAWISKDGIDAFFTVENDTESQSILKKLNGISIGDDRLSASLLPNNSSSVPMSENESSRGEMALQINSYLTDIKMQREKAKVHLEDLQMLHDGIMHLEDLPTVIDPPNI